MTYLFRPRWIEGREREGDGGKREYNGEGETEGSIGFDQKIQ